MRTEEEIMEMLVVINKLVMKYPKDHAARCMRALLTIILDRDAEDDLVYLESIMVKE